LPVEKSFMLNFHYLPKEEALGFDCTWVEKKILKNLMSEIFEKMTWKNEF
jgi:hypothetical protein